MLGASRKQRFAFFKDCSMLKVKRRKPVFDNPCGGRRDRARHRPRRGGNLAAAGGRSPLPGDALSAYGDVDDVVAANPGASIPVSST
jgi:hypothetical protein